jgi:hypothetical protein
MPSSRSRDSARTRFRPNPDALVTSPRLAFAQRGPGRILSRAARPFKPSIERASRSGRASCLADDAELVERWVADPFDVHAGVEAGLEERDMLGPDALAGDEDGHAGWV